MKDYEVIVEVTTLMQVKAHSRRKAAEYAARSFNQVFKCGKVILINTKDVKEVKQDEEL